MRQQARSARKKNKEVFFSSPTTIPLRWVDFEEKIESVNRLYSVTTCEQKTKDCARSGSFQLQCLPAFMTSLPDCNSYVFMTVCKNLTPNMKGVGMFVVLLRGVNFGFWSHLGCSGQNAVMFSREGLV